jgi:hypothetical protein
LYFFEAIFSVFFCAAVGVILSGKPTKGIFEITIAG